MDNTRQEDHSKSKSHGGTTCGVPFCKSNSLNNPELSFHQFPKDLDIKETWLNLLGIDKQPLKSHKVCSLHFPGGKKSFGALPTVLNCSGRQTFNSNVGRNDITPDCSTISNVQDLTKFEQQETTLQKSNDEQATLRAENIALKGKCEELTCRYTQSVLRIEHVLASNIIIKFYTGFQNYQTFKAFFDYLQPACQFLNYAGSNSSTEYSLETQQKVGRTSSMSPEQELFMILVRLRCGLMGPDLAFRFSFSETQVSRIWVTWLEFLYHRLRAIPIWASQEYIQKTMPEAFKNSYPNTRVIIDCTEIFIEKPTSFRSQSATYSAYKNHNTAKGLLGISPAGYPTFVSELYAGRSSDKQITKDCGILNLLESGDQVMADRGFDIENEMPPGVGLNIPPFLDGAPQLSLQDEVKTRKIASLRVHVERTIQRIKSYKILSNVFPLKMSSDLNKIWVICSYLTLFYPPLINANIEIESNT